MLLLRRLLLLHRRSDHLVVVVVVGHMRGALGRDHQHVAITHAANMRLHRSSTRTRRATGVRRWR